VGLFVEGEDRRQSLLLSELLDDHVTEDNRVGVVEAFIDELDLGALGFEGVKPASTGRPAYHPSATEARARPTVADPAVEVVK
jgi:transposase